MSHKIVNLTLPIVIREIDDVLEEYPVHPYQKAFAIDEVRKKLLAHVLSYIPNRYIVLDETQEPPKDDDFIYRSLEERVRIESLIRGSILHILRENADLVSRHVYQIDSSIN